MVDSLRQYPFLRLLLPLVAGVLCGDAFPCIRPAWGGLLLVLLFFLMACRYRPSGPLYGVATFTFLACTGYCLMSWQLRQTDFPFRGEPSVYKVRLREKPQTRPRSMSCPVVLLEAFDNDTAVCFPREYLFRMYLPRDTAAASLQRGDELLIRARLTLPDAADYARYLRRKGYSGTVRIPAGGWTKTGHDGSRSLLQVASDCRQKVVGLYRRLGFEGDELAVLSALTVGEKEELSDELKETYSAAGASHVLALSGLHIGFLYAGLLWLFGLLWRRWRWLKPFLSVLTVLLMVGFAFFTGLSPSVVRSVVMFSFLVLADLLHGEALPLNTLSAAAFSMLLFRPGWLFDAGFQLSFAAVGSILIIQPWLYRQWRVWNRPLRGVWALLTVSIAAQLGTAPLVMLYFSRFPVHFLLTSLWVIPVVSLILYLAVLLLLLTPLPAVQHPLAWALEALVRMLHAGLRWVEQLPLATLDGIRFDRWDAVLCFLFIGTAYYSLVRRTGRSVLLSLSVLLLAVSYHFVLFFYR